MMFTIGAFCFGTVCYYDDHLTLNGIGEAGVNTHKTLQSDPLCLFVGQTPYVVVFDRLWFSR